MITYTNPHWKEFIMNSTLTIEDASTAVLTKLECQLGN
jgi:hypothetical protein